MKVVVFGSGLGNQLFHYLFYVYLKAKEKNVWGVYCRKEHNGFEITKYFDVQIKMSSISSVIVSLLFFLFDKLHSRIASSFFIRNERKIWWRSFIHIGVWQEKNI